MSRAARVRVPTTPMTDSGSCLSVTTYVCKPQIIPLKQTKSLTHLLKNRGYDNGSYDRWSSRTRMTPPPSRGCLRLNTTCLSCCAVALLGNNMETSFTVGLFRRPICIPLLVLMPLVFASSTGLSEVCIDILKSSTPSG